MSAVTVRSVISNAVLISRDSARQLEGPLRECANYLLDHLRDQNAHELTLDFEGISGVSPSFIDEIIRILKSLNLLSSEVHHLRFVIANPPTRLSSKFQAIARSHDLIVQQTPDGSWLIDIVKATTAD